MEDVLAVFSKLGSSDGRYGHVQDVVQHRRHGFPGFRGDGVTPPPLGSGRPHISALAHSPLPHRADIQAIQAHLRNKPFTGKFTLARSESIEMTLKPCIHSICS